MTDLDLLKVALRNVAERGQVTVQVAAAYQALLNEIVRLQGERDNALYSTGR